MRAAGDCAGLVPARSARARPSRAAGRARRARPRRARLLLRRPPPARPPRIGPAHAVHARVPARPRPRAGERGAGLVVRHGPPERELPRACPGDRGRPRSTSPTTSPVRAPRGERMREALRDAGIELVPIPASPWSTTWPRCARRAAAVHGLLARSSAPGSGSPRRECWARRERSRCPRTPRAVPVARRPRACEQEVDGAHAGRRDGGARAAGALPARRRRRLRGQPRRARRATGRSRLSPYLHFGCVSPREVEERLPGGEGPRRSGASCAGATSTTRCFSTIPRNASVGVPGALPRRDRLERRRARFAAWTRGPHRLPAGRRRDAPAPPRGVDAQPRPARGRLVPDQGPRHRLALGRALVHAPADRRRRGATTTATGSGSPRSASTPSPPSGASTTRRATWSASTPTALRPPLRARAARRARRVPGRAVEDAGRGPARRGLRDRRGLP